MSPIKLVSLFPGTSFFLTKNEAREKKILLPGISETALMGDIVSLSRDTKTFIERYQS